MSYWFPKLAKVGFSMPRTKLIKMPKKALEDIFREFDNEPSHGDAKPFFKEVGQAAIDIGFPIFLRSGLTSGKHDWSTTCFVCTVPDIKEHLKNILYFSLCVGVPDTNIWAVREMLPIQPVGICLKYNGMPVNREFRYFVNGKRILCRHPYWPRKVLEEGGCFLTDEQYEKLCMPPPSKEEDIVSYAGEILGGKWSIDILETADGWYLTDVAEAEKSFHWDGCKYDL